MKNMKFFPWQLLIVLVLAGCGPIVISSRPDYPPPAWFYPNRVEVVRYVYFPEYTIYYDLTAHSYLYLNNGAWIRVDVLPPRYRNIDLRRSRYLRIKDYSGENIQQYHLDRGRSNTSSNSGRKN